MKRELKTISKNLSRLTVLLMLVFLLGQLGCAGGGDSSSGGSTPCTDSDGDGVCNTSDNCVNDANADQADSDDDDIGNVCDNCPSDKYNDVDDDDVCGNVDNCPTVSNSGQEDTGGVNGVGDACEVAAPTVNTAALLSVSSGCVTYQGDNPVEPGQGYTQSYEFCSDGTVTKEWNPDPVDNPDLPGDTVCTGTWSYTGNQLTITTTATVLSVPMVTTEVYDVAYTYDSGAKLDFNSAAQVTSNATSVLGMYERHSTADVTMTGMMEMESTIDTVLAVSVDTAADVNADWSATMTTEIACSGLACGMVTTIVTGVTENTTSGTFTMPGTLYNFGSTYVLQVTDALVLDAL